jgi:hypothetical protein
MVAGACAAREAMACVLSAAPPLRSPFARLSRRPPSPRSVRDRGAAPRPCREGFLSFLRPNLVSNRRRRKTLTGRTRWVHHHHSPTNVHREDALAPVPRRPAAGFKAARKLDREGPEVSSCVFFDVGRAAQCKKRPRTSRGAAPKAAMGFPGKAFWYSE